MLTPKLTKQQMVPFYPTQRSGDIKHLRHLERQISMPDHLQEYKEKILYDRHVSAPDEPYLSELSPSISQQVSKWKDMEMTELADILQNELLADDRSEFLEELKSESAIRDDEEEQDGEEEQEEVKEPIDEVCNGRLQIILTKNHRRKRKPRRAIKSYHSRFNIKSDLKPVKNNQEEEHVKKEKHFEQLVGSKEDGSKVNQLLNTVSPLGRLKKDSTDEYESVESSEEDSKIDPITEQNHSETHAPRNERIITIEREISVYDDAIAFQNEEKDSKNNFKANDILSDKESIGKSHSDELIGTDFKEPEGSYSNSIPFIDDDDDNELFSDAGEEVLFKADENKMMLQNDEKEIGDKPNKDNGSSSKTEYTRGKSTIKSELVTEITEKELSERIDHTHQNGHVKREEKLKKLHSDKNHENSEISFNLTDAEEEKSQINNEKLQQTEAKKEMIIPEKILDEKTENISEDESESDEIKTEQSDQETKIIIIETQSTDTNDEIDKTNLNAKMKDTEESQKENQEKMSHQNKNTDKQVIEKPGNQNRLNDAVIKPKYKNNGDNNKKIAKDLEIEKVKVKENVTKKELDSNKNKESFSTGDKDRKKSNSKSDTGTINQTVGSSKINNGKNVATSNSQKLTKTEATTKIKENKSDLKVSTSNVSNFKTIATAKMPNVNSNGIAVKTKAINGNEKTSNAIGNAKKIVAKNDTAKSLTKSVTSKTKTSTVDSNTGPQVSNKKADIRTPKSPTGDSIQKENISISETVVNTTDISMEHCNVELENCSSVKSNDLFKDIPLEDKNEKQNVMNEKNTEQNETTTIGTENVLTVEIQEKEELEKGNSEKQLSENAGLNSDDTSPDDTSNLISSNLDNQTAEVKVDENTLPPTADENESSRKDIISIPKVSEDNKSKDEDQQLKLEVNKKIVKREEMVTFIKESLSKDVVLDRLVGTLLGALQGEGDTILKGQDLASVFVAHQTKQVPLTEGGDMVTALQLAQDINVNPKEALEETLLHTDTIKISTEVKDELQLRNEEFQVIILLLIL